MHKFKCVSQSISNKQCFQFGAQFKDIANIFDEDDLLLLNTIQSRKYSLVLKLEDISDAQCKNYFVLIKQE